MESFNDHLLIRLTYPENDHQSLSQHSFYTYMQQKEFAGTYPKVVKHIERVYEVSRKLTEKEFMERFDVKLPQKSSGLSGQPQGFDMGISIFDLPHSADMANKDSLISKSHINEPDDMDYKDEVFGP